MKKLLFLLTFVLCVGLSNDASAQFKFGAGVETWLEGKTTFGVQGKALYGLSDQLTANGSFTYYLSDFLDWSIDVGAHYALLDMESFRLAPLAGIDVTRASAGNASSTNTALQIGAFIELPMDGLNIYAEPKLVIDSGSGLVLSAGVLF